MSLKEKMQGLFYFHIIIIIIIMMIIIIYLFVFCFFFGVFHLANWILSIRCLFVSYVSLIETKEKANLALERSDFSYL